jgi:hypothetical protein
MMENEKMITKAIALALYFVALTIGLAYAVHFGWIRL